MKAVVATLGFLSFAAMGIVWVLAKCHTLDEMAVGRDLNRAAIEETAREIAAFDAETKAHARAVDALASWYGPPFDGNQTANGETYDRWALTCAALDYPLGSWLKITDKRTRRWVVVRVTDRGPYAPGRSIDLSEAAAHSLGIRRQGVAVVEVAILEGR